MDDYVISKTAFQYNDVYSCEKLFKGDKYTLQAVDEFYQKFLPQKLLQNVEKRLSNLIKTLARKSCLEYITHRQYLIDNISKEERDFPLAFAIIAHTRASQVERLLRAIYSPTNFYCIHIDKKADLEFRDAVQSFADCFDNVHVLKDSLEVYWGEMSVLEAHLSCMQFLIKRNTKWKYFINMAGTEFPIWGNPQLVRILSAYNGANDVEGFDDYMDYFRWQYQHHFSLWNSLFGHRIKRSALPKTPPPHGLVMAKGMVSVAVSRAFVEKIFSSSVIIKDFLKWLSDSWVPDESFFSTLNHNPDVIKMPGGFNRSVKNFGNLVKPTLVRKMVWRSKDTFCGGFWEHDICLFGEIDMPSLANLKQLFINKLDVTKSPAVYQCMEVLQRNKTIIGRQLNYRFDTSEYANQVFVTHQQKTLK